MRELFTIVALNQHGEGFKAGGVKHTSEPHVKQAFKFLGARPTLILSDSLIRHCVQLNTLLLHFLIRLSLRWEPLQFTSLSPRFIVMF